MSGRPAALVAILSAILAACSAGAGPAPSDPVGVATPGATSSLAGVTPAPTISVASPSLAPTPTPTPKPTPTPTSAAVPPKPSALFYAPCCGEGNWDPSSVSWDKPRTKGVEIRVYGVTTCFPAGDRSDETCLREHVTLPDGIGVLLAKGPASTGKLSWQQGEGEGEGCVAEYLSDSGTPFYSIVVAAYNASGHSIFGIVDEGYYDTEACAPYIMQKGDTLRRIAARFNVAVDDLIAANKSTLPNPDKLQVGATILIPQPVP